MSGFYTKTKKILPEWIRLVFLTALVLYTYHPFNSGLNLGGMDARWYQYLLHDAILQFNHGFFPPIVGQSEFNYLGVSNIRAPYYLFFGLLIHLLTFGQLSALYIQHLTVLISALLAAYIMYFVLSKLVPRLRWFALMFAFFYISCPGIVALIDLMDMYNSFMTVPFIPLTLYGLVRAQQKNDFLAYILVTIGLSLIWLAHPPIALWMLTISLLFFTMQFLFQRKGLGKFLLIPCLFLLLNCWQFIGVIHFGLQNILSPDAGPNYTFRFVNNLMITLKNDIPGVFLPLLWKIPTHTPFLQLGYSLWVISFAAAIVCWRIRRFTLITLLICIVFLMLLLYPLPWISYFLWSLFPRNVYEVTYWPMQRLYLILAALTCFIGMLALEHVYMSCRFFFRAVIFTLFLLFCGWNLFQLNFFFRIGPSKGVDSSWVIPQNIYLMPYGALPTHYKLAEIRTFEPVLQNQLLDENYLPIPTYDNQQILTDQCIKSLMTLPDGMMIAKTNAKLPFKVTSNSLMPFIHIKGLIEKNLLLCFETYLDSVRISAEVINPKYVAENFLESPETTALTKRIFSMPFFAFSSNQPNNDEFFIYLSRVDLGYKKTAPIDVTSFGLISYNPNQLPIKITSFTPYQAQVKTDRPHTYLSVFKEFFPGYEAKVNGKAVPVFASKDQMILIPLQNKGENHVELFFHGSSSLRLTLLMSGITWLLLILSGVVFGYRKYKYAPPSIN